MKNRLTVFIASLILFIGCSDDFTSIIPVGFLPDEALQNEEGVDLLLTGAYARLNGGGFDQPADNWWLDAITDDAHKGSTDGDQSALFEIEMLRWETSNGYFRAKWQIHYGGMNRANAVIALIGNIEGADLNGKLAEARFLRAYHNFQVQRMFGNVPYISEENYINTEFNQPNPGPIWDQIEADYQFAIDNLPDSQESPGRPNSWTAKAFLAKVLLQQSKWDEAFTIFQDVISNGPYDLLPEFVDNFRLAGDNSTESVFAIQFAANDANSPQGNSGGTLNFPNGGPFNSCCGFYQPTQDLVNAFKTGVDGLPLLDTFNQTDVVNDYGINSDESFAPHTGPLDPRLDYTVGRRGIDYNAWGTMPGKEWIRAGFADISGPYLSKKNIYHNGEAENQGTGSWGQQFSGINYHVMRFSDLLLMAAEAAVEKSSPDLTLALEYVNRVRNRAKNMTYVSNEDGTANAANYVIEPYGTFADQAFARKAIRHERRLELGMEGHRLYDLRRWGISQTIIEAYLVNEARTIGNIEDKKSPYQTHYDLFPIPLRAIDESGNILEQNSGY